MCLGLSIHVFFWNPGRIVAWALETESETANCRVAWVGGRPDYSVQGVSDCFGVFHQCLWQVFAFCGLVEMLTTFVTRLHQLFRLRLDGRGVKQTTLQGFKVKRQTSMETGPLILRRELTRWSGNRRSGKREFDHSEDSWVLETEGLIGEQCEGLIGVRWSDLCNWNVRCVSSASKTCSASQVSQAWNRVPTGC